VKSNCVLAAGGHIGHLLQDLLLKEHLSVTTIATKGMTRENFSVVDTHTQLQYRFGMPGCELSNDEMDIIKSHIKKDNSTGDILVLSGSLSQNMPFGFYGQLIKSLKNSDTKVVVDTSGIPLQKALDEGVYLIKPNQKELAQLAGVKVLISTEQEKFAMKLVNSKKTELVVVSLGARGAFLASKNGIIYQPTPSVKVKSTIGAGDSMVAGLIYGIMKNLNLDDILKWGVACGVATTLSEGTQLAEKAEIDNSLKML
jgi:6-phosphofructokinase 2